MRGVAALGRLPHGPRPCAPARPRPRTWRRGPGGWAAAAAGPDAGGDGGSYSPDETAAYDELLQQKRAAKQQALEDLKRERRLNPPAAKAKLDARRAAGGGGSGGGRAGSQPAPFAARPRVAPAALQQQQQQQQQRQQRQQRQQQQDAGPAAQLLDGGPSEDDLQAMLSELLGDGADSVPEVEALPKGPARLRRRTPAQVRAAAMARRAAAGQRQGRRSAAGVAADGDTLADGQEADSTVTAAGRPRHGAAGAGVSPAQLQLLQQVATAAAAAEAADEGEEQEGEEQEGEEQEDDLDWEALGQYEELEQYLGQLRKEQASPQHRAVGQPPAQLPASAAASATAAAAEAEAAQGGKRKRKSRRQAAEDMHRDLDELEELAALLEAMQPGSSGGRGGGGGSSAAASAPRPAAAGAAAAGAAAAGAAAADPGEALLRAFLGPDWEAELLDELAAVVDGEDEDAGASAAAQQGGAAAAQQPGGGQGQEQEQQPWEDEVTALLLGLVAASHERYLRVPVPLQDAQAASEELRCGGFWGAPWALLVLDDTEQAAVEYANEAAGRMLGGGYLDLFGQPAHDLVSQDLEAQSDWAYAVRRVESSAAFCARLPRLELRDLAGRRVEARDVTMWRVDSLEDTPVGIAVLARTWGPAGNQQDGQQQQAPGEP